MSEDRARRKMPHRLWRIRRWFRRLRTWWWVLWNEPIRIELPEPTCEHDVQPEHDNSEWGRCAKCGEGGFPLTERAAWGNFQCPICHDTGMVAVTVDSRPEALADAPCPADCSAALVHRTEEPARGPVGRLIRWPLKGLS